VATIVVMIIVWWRRSAAGRVHIPRAKMAWLRQRRTGEGSA
jgi:hypothetical protein